MCSGIRCLFIECVRGLGSGESQREDEGPGGGPRPWQAPKGWPGWKRTVQGRAGSLPLSLYQVGGLEPLLITLNYSCGTGFHVCQACALAPEETPGPQSTHFCYLEKL